MWNRQELKSNARIMLKANYLKIVIVSVVFALLTSSGYQSAKGAAKGSDADISLSHLTDIQWSLVMAAFVGIMGVVIIAFLVNVLIAVFVWNPLSVGCIKYFIDCRYGNAEWKDILAVYTVKISNGKNDAEVMTLDNNKISILKEIFWEMNEITSSTEEVTYKDNKKKIVLHINVNGKDALEMAQKYNFSIEQNKQLAELLDKQYASLWSSVIYGSSVGNTDIVEVAKKQIGNIGGQPFWSWYGYNSRVEWCACFVSWCANECGYIEAGIIPKFASCESEGVAWFKTCGLWQEKGYTPKSGDIIFFDWADSNDGLADHVGIVSRVENGIIYTVEGNTRGDVCKENKYSIDSSVIRGFGTPAYK